MATLPIFHTAGGDTTDVDVERLSHDVLGGQDMSTTSRGPRTEVRGAEVHVDLDRAHGGLWAGDLTRLGSTERIEVPGDGAVVEIARDAMRHTRLTPELRGPFRLLEGAVRRTLVAQEEDGRRDSWKTDATFAQDVVVDVSDRAGARALGDSTLPVLGGGGHFTTTVGDGGQVVGQHGVWRRTEEADEREVRSVEEALEAAGIALDGDDFRVTQSRLGYYSAPPFSGQELLFPVYAVGGEVRDGDRWVPSRIRLVPATDVGEVAPPEHKLPDRKPPVLSPKPGTLPLRPGMALPHGVSVSTRLLNERGLKPQDVLTRAPSGTIFVKPQLDATLLPLLLESTRARSFGASWIGTMGGLGGSQGNAQGFVDEMSAEGWARRFNWGNEAAWKSDWVSNDDNYVDNVDFVFYTGHASPDGWMLASNGSGDWLHHNDVGAQPNMPSDLWGQKNLEWVVVAACGPLQDDLINGGGNVFDRWRGAFDGLHLMLGYAAVTYDNTEEGRRLASYARSGMTLRQAWFRTAQEIQPSTNGFGDPYGPDVYAAAMYIGNSDGNTANDHIWGRGSVGPDIRNSTFRGCSFSPC